MSDLDLLSKELDFLDPPERAEILDIIACALHNKGYELQGNSEAMDLEWLARNLWERSDWRRVGWHWENDRLVTEEVREEWRNLARVVLQLMPLYYGRIGQRCARYSEAVRTLERAERAKGRARDDRTHG